MTRCKFCGKDKRGAVSCCRYTIVIDNRNYAPIPFGPQSRQIIPIVKKEIARCPDCNVQTGGLHHVGCGLELCPCCGKRWIYCRCNGKKVKRADLFSGKKIIPFPQPFQP